MNRSTVFDLDETVNRLGGDDDPKLVTKPHNVQPRFMDKSGPPVLTKGQSFGASSFPAPPPQAPTIAPESPSRIKLIPQDEKVEGILSDMRQALKQRGAVGLTGLARNFRINDVDKSGKLDRDELKKCLRLCKIEITDDNDLDALLLHIDESGDGTVDYEEFLRALRGPMPAMRKRLVVDVFHAIDDRSRGDRRGRSDGQLTMDDLQDLFDGKSHPEVKAGRMSASTVLTEMLKNFEGRGGNRDGAVTLQEWTSHYADLSASIDNDDHFAAMMTSAWPALFDKELSAARGFGAPLEPPVPQATVDNLESLLRTAVTARSTAASETKALEKAFAAFDKDNSKAIQFDEFKVAMERFGLATSSGAGDVSGVTEKTVRALFDRYDTDGAGSLSYDEFVRGLFKEEAPLHTRTNRLPPPAEPATGTSLALPSERGGGSRPPTGSFKVDPSTGVLQESHARGRGGMLQGGLNLGIENQRAAPASAHGRASGATNGFNKSSGIFR